MDDSTFPHHGEAERWLPVVGWEGRYEVSDLGRVRSLPHRTATGVRGGGLVRQVINQRGYCAVELKRSHEGRSERATKQVHRLVLEAFVGPCPPGFEPCHGVNGKLDNRLSELRWDTPGANNGADKVRDGKSNRGERSATARLTAGIVAECKRRYAAGESQHALAAEFGVVPSAVSNAIRGVTWTHIASDTDEVRPAHVGDTAGERNTKAKLTWAAVAEIRRRYAAGGVTYRALAAEYGVDFTIIARVVAGKTWKPSP